MWKTLFTVVSLLANVTSTFARPYVRDSATIDAATLAKVRANAISISQRRCVVFTLQPPSLPNPPSDPSWEIGTVTEALLEYSWPQLSVFNNTPIPPARQLFATDYPYEVVNIATQCVTSSMLHKKQPRDAHCSPGLLTTNPTTPWH